MNDDSKKGSVAFSSFLQKASDAGKQAVAGVQKGAVTISEKASEAGKRAATEVQVSAAAFSEKVKEDSYQRRLKKYNPLFAEEYTGEVFRLPHLIVIVDDAVRQGIDVCEGAIGWRNIEGDAEVLYLHNDALKLRKLQFYPSAMCNAAYYVDNFNPNRYIRVDCIFSKAHEERLAELENVAHSLGAKNCTIEITESDNESNSLNRSAGIGLKSKLLGSLSGKAEDSITSARRNMRSGKITAQFEGSDEPRRPKLKWFAHDENIKKLIDERCKRVNAVKFKTLELAGSTSATMTHKTAASIDGTINKIGFKGSFSLQSQAMVEHTTKLIFSVEF